MKEKTKKIAQNKKIKHGAGPNLLNLKKKKKKMILLSFLIFFLLYPDPDPGEIINADPDPQS